MHTHLHTLTCMHACIHTYLSLYIYRYLFCIYIHAIERVSTHSEMCANLCGLIWYSNGFADAPLLTQLRVCICIYNCFDSSMRCSHCFTECTHLYTHIYIYICACVHRVDLIPAGFIQFQMGYHTDLTLVWYTI